jgi:hypothetical protein
MNFFWLKDLNLLLFFLSWLLVIADLGSSGEEADAISGELSWCAAISRLFFLIKVEFLALHGNVLTEVLISVHASSKVAIGLWSLNKCLRGSEEQGNNICGLLVHFKLK